MEIKTIINDLFTHVSGRELNEEELTSTAEAFVKIGARQQKGSNGNILLSRLL